MAQASSKSPDNSVSIRDIGRATFSGAWVDKQSVERIHCAIRALSKKIKDRSRHTTRMHVDGVLCKVDLKPVNGRVVEVSMAGVNTLISARITLALHKTNGKKS